MNNGAIYINDPKKRRKCPLCNQNLYLYYVSFEEMFLMCENTYCDFPFGYEAMQIVRDESQLRENPVKATPDFFEYPLFGADGAELPSMPLKRRTDTSVGTTSSASCSYLSDCDQPSQISKSDDIIDKEEQLALRLSRKERKRKIQQQTDEEIESVVKDIDNLTRPTSHTPQVIKNKKWLKNLKALEGRHGKTLWEDNENKVFVKSEPNLSMGELNISVDPNAAEGFSPDDIFGKEEQLKERKRKIQQQTDKEIESVVKDTDELTRPTSPTHQVIENKKWLKNLKALEGRHGKTLLENNENKVFVKSEPNLSMGEMNISVDPNAAEGFSPDDIFGKEEQLKEKKRKIQQQTDKEIESVVKDTDELTRPTSPTHQVIENKKWLKNLKALEGRHGKTLLENNENKVFVKSEPNLSMGEMNISVDPNAAEGFSPDDIFDKEEQLKERKRKIQQQTDKEIESVVKDIDELTRPTSPTHQVIENKKWLKNLKALEGRHGKTLLEDNENKVFVKSEPNLSMGELNISVDPNAAEGFSPTVNIQIFMNAPKKPKEEDCQ